MRHRRTPGSPEGQRVCGVVDDEHAATFILLFLLGCSHRRRHALSIALTPCVCAAFPTCAVDKTENAENTEEALQLGGALLAEVGGAERKRIADAMDFKLQARKQAEKYRALEGKGSKDDELDKGICVAEEEASSLKRQLDFTKDPARHHDECT